MFAILALSFLPDNVTVFTTSEKKSDKFHKKCSTELWTILMFELLLCCHTAAQCMERT